MTTSLLSTTTIRPTTPDTDLSLEDARTAAEVKRVISRLERLAAEQERCWFCGLRGVSRLGARLRGAIRLGRLCPGLKLGVRVGSSVDSVEPEERSANDDNSGDGSADPLADDGEFGGHGASLA